MNVRALLAGGFALLAIGSVAAAEVVRSEANNGNLVMEDVPPIPQSVVADLNRYQNVRSAGFVAWDRDGEGIFVRTRFGDVPQLHHVDHPGGARTQLTFFDEPIGGVLRQPGGSRMVFTMDAGGSEFAQIFLLDPASGADAVLLTDGESRNGAVVWDRNGQWIAYQSTRRNGASNDIWMMDVDNPETAGIVLESPDGTWWGGVDFSADNQYLLVGNYVGNADSRIYLLHLESGERRPGHHHGRHPLARGGRGTERGARPHGLRRQRGGVLAVVPARPRNARVPAGRRASDRAGRRPRVQPRRAQARIDAEHGKDAQRLVRTDAGRDTARLR
ncbi:MAG: hypothetical protein P8Y54_10645 [Xanthomonadales bacterium]